MDPLVADLAAQHRELDSILRSLRADQWRAPTRCDGWDVADVVLHLAQTDEMAVASVHAPPDEPLPAFGEPLTGAESVDEGAAAMVERERGRPGSELLERWASAAASLVGSLERVDLSTRVTWVVGQLSARTLATTRLAETWIHGGDVASAVGVDLVATDRPLHPIARLAWRTLPYAFVRGGLELQGPVAFHLVSPGGRSWDFVPEDPPVTVVRGPAAELCAVAARRVDPSDTRLIAYGADGETVLSLVRTYA